MLDRSRSRITDGSQRATQHPESSQGVEPKQRRDYRPCNDQVKRGWIRIDWRSIWVEAAGVGETPKQNAHPDDETHHPKCDSHGEPPGSRRKELAVDSARLSIRHGGGFIVASGRQRPAPAGSRPRGRHIAMPGSPGDKNSNLAHRLDRSQTGATLSGGRVRWNGFL